jgi:hypothetical protein
MAALFQGAATREMLATIDIATAAKQIPWGLSHSKGRYWPPPKQKIIFA